MIEDVLTLGDLAESDPDPVRFHAEHLVPGKPVVVLGRFPADFHALRVDVCGDLLGDVTRWPGRCSVIAAPRMAGQVEVATRPASGLRS